MESLRGQDGGEMVLSAYQVILSARSTRCNAAALLVAPFSKRVISHAYQQWDIH